ncbi:calcium:proton antiporter [Verticiella sediminum]|uniref:Calcium:proton antiporter n=1 Tax=Verticiella sediminum TaxID=1247510 RepID=A0A556AJ12_9BURK|nr:calcium:proton antiporter [Verticiella sediminum]TSH92873.1 calcium:proton antiporter [Verticiella sediminum]
MLKFLAQERLLALAIVVGALAYAFEGSLVAMGRWSALGAAVALIAAIVCTSLSVAHRAELLAEKVGDPYGTMILTLSAVLVEVIVLAIMMTHEPTPTLVRDTIYAAVMLDINGILGLAALMGGLKHGEQAYNDDSGRTYGVMILTAMGISMVVPEFIPRDRWEIYSIFTIVAMLTLYALFLRMQTGVHSYFFSYAYPEKRRPRSAGRMRAVGAVAGGLEAADKPGNGRDSLRVSIGVLVFGVILIGFLAELMSPALDVGLEGAGAPPILLALVVATISACPEILTALRAALANRMQSVVNVAMGASLSTVILTVPVMEAWALYLGAPFQMAMTPVQTVMVMLTLIAAAINLNDGQSNAIEGMTHFVLFATFLMLSFLGL